MGNELRKPSTSKYILNDFNFQKLENRLFEQSGLPRSDIIVKNVKVGEWQNRKGQIESVNVHTIIVGSIPNKSLKNQDKPILVWVHGFAASGAIYFTLFKKLSEKFVVVTIDLVGMG